MTRFLIPVVMVLLSGISVHAQDSAEVRQLDSIRITARARLRDCPLYTSHAADQLLCLDLGSLRTTKTDII